MDWVCFFPSFEYCLVQPLSPSLLQGWHSTISPQQWLSSFLSPGSFLRAGCLQNTPHIYPHIYLLAFISLAQGKPFRDLKSQISFVGLECIFLSERKVRLCQQHNLSPSCFVATTKCPMCSLLSHPPRVSEFSFWDLLLSAGIVCDRLMHIHPE